MLCDDVELMSVVKENRENKRNIYPKQKGALNKHI